MKNKSFNSKLSFNKFSFPLLRNLKLRTIILIVIFIFQFVNVYAQNYQWAKKIGSTGNEFGLSIAVDDSGSSYITGVFEGTVDFDPGTGTAYLTSIGSQDIYFAKFDTNGNLLWAKSIGSTDIDNGYSIAIDDSGNCYLSGSYAGTTDFDPSAGIANLFLNGFQSTFFAKYNSNGDYIWAKGLGGTYSNNYALCIAVDSTGNVYITGEIQGSADFDPGTGTANLSSIGNEDIFFAKYDNNGNYLWAKVIGSNSIDKGSEIVVDNTGNCYVTGVFMNTVDFDTDTGIANLISIGGWDIYFAKYDTYGNYVWANSIGSIGDDFGACIAIDNTGNCYIGGYINNSADFDPGTGIANLTSAGSYFAKYDNNGNYLWAKGLGSGYCNYLVVDIFGNLYISGIFQGTADFDPGPGIVNLTSAGLGDFYFAKYATGGTYLWANSIGSSTANDFGGDIAADNNGNCYLSGGFGGIADFDPGTATVNLLNSGNNDIYLAKYIQNPNSKEIINQESIKFFPNPTKNNIVIKGINNGIIEIINLEGQILKYIEIKYDKTNIDLSNLSSGIYMIKIITNNGIIVQKLIKD